MKEGRGRTVASQGNANHTNSCLMLCFIHLRLWDATGGVLGNGVLLGTPFSLWTKFFSFHDSILKPSAFLTTLLHTKGLAFRSWRRVNDALCGIPTRACGAQRKETTFPYGTTRHLDWEEREKNPVILMVCLHSTKHLEAGWQTKSFTSYSDDFFFFLRYAETT